jgi:eukaryotic-like serine/threonine-protein kinase
MKAKRWAEVRRIFEELVEVDEAGRVERLAAAAVDDPELAKHVRNMLRANDRSDDDLEPPVGADLDLAGPARTIGAVPERIGSYRLLRAIGSGGMGTVYEVEQDEPRRTVALKVMRTELTSDAALRRFRFESEVLARLQHPGIAQVYEAGTHEDESAGTRVPWFAMELVSPSRTVDQFAETLDLEGRIRLFLLICDAVHYGHQKGVIHRDLKASNILVSEAGEPKIIDFGIARISGADVASTRLTMAGEIVGTLGAMSPEQLAGNVADVDTRADVYALGALLYEFVADRPPFDLRDTPLPEALRKLCEDPPPRPGEVKSGLASELDWIVLQAMAPDREDRYASASELAADLERFLTHEPVLAGPPTTAYRMRKFVRRHRWSVGGTIALLAGLIAALAWITSIYVRADRERDKAVAINDFLTLALSSADPVYDGPDARVVDVLDRAFELSATAFEDQPEVRAALLNTVGVTYRGLGQYDRAREHLEASVELYRELHGSDSVDGLVALRNLGASLLADDQDPEEAARVLRKAHAGLRDALGPQADETLRAENTLGLALLGLGEFEAAERHLRASLEAYRERHGDLDRSTIRFTGELANFLVVTGEYEESEALFRRALSSQNELSGPDHVDALGVRNNFAGLLLGLDRADEAKAVMEQAHRAAILKAGPEHPLTLTLASGLGQTMVAAHEFDAARDVLEETLEALLRVRGEHHPLTLEVRLGLGTCLYFLRDYAEAEDQLRIAIEGLEAAFGPTDERTMLTRNNLAMMLQARQMLPEAEELLHQNLEARREIHGDLHPDTLNSINNLGFLISQAGRLDEARPLLEEAMEGGREVLGADHVLTLGFVINVADLHHRAGRLSEAIPLWIEVLDLGQEAFAHEPAKLADIEQKLEKAMDEKEATDGESTGDRP